MRSSLLVVIALMSSGCLSVETKFLLPPQPLVCRDGRPVFVIQHPECANGVCGYTCAPDRWRDYVRQP